MRSYSVEEKDRARKKLPEPIIDFLGSPALTTIYLGLRDKLKLNLRQLMIVSEIANVTLTGLEEEHALEASLHQYLPEMSNADMRELVADLNDRVFKEAQRRLRENVLEPKEAIVSRITPDGEGFLGEEIKAIPIPISLEQNAHAKEAADAGAQTDTPSEELDTSGKQSVFEERLATPVRENTKIVDTREIKAGIQQVSLAPSKAGTLAAPDPETPASQGPRVYHGTDPYREPIE